MTKWAAAVLIFTAACTSTTAKLPPADTYTRAKVATLSTAELARQLLPPEEAAVAERHVLTVQIWPDEPLSGIIFRSRPVPFDKEICARQSQMVQFRPVRKGIKAYRSGDIAVRKDDVSPFTHYAINPDCAPMPGRRFARWQDWRTADSEAIPILKSLAAAQRLAAGTAPLPFKLTCEVGTTLRDFECPTDVRKALATLPLHRATTVERNPFPNNCDHSSRDIGDAIEINMAVEDEADVWDIRLRKLGTAEAEILMLRQFPRTEVKC
jgi:hypothetical protein